MKVLIPASKFLSAATVSPATGIARHLLIALMFVVAVGLFPATAFSQGTPDGQTPAEETVCDGLEGAAFGLCNAYCEATDCGDGVNYASFKACASLQKNWIKKTGLEEFPCECEEGFVFNPDTGCECGHDLVVRILDFEPLGCPTGQGSCEYLMDVEVENLGSQDIVDPFDVMVELPGVGLGNSANFPGLPAGTTDQALDIPLGPGDNCFDPDCEIEAEVDPGNVIEECNEDNNTDFLVILG